MKETNKTTQTNDRTKDNSETSNKPGASASGGSAGASKGNNDRSEGGGAKKTFVGKRARKKRQEKFKPEFDQKILGIRRVTRVMAGGRRFSFSVSMVVGDRKGRVGVGVGKAGDTAAAIEKASNTAKKNMVRLPLTKNMSIPHEVEAKFCGSRVLIMPAPGRGVVAGGAVRSVLDLGGVHDVSAKILSRSKNALNNSQVAVKALRSLAGEPQPEKKEDKQNEKEGKETESKQTA
jgi:small subunit ribosomal protein S5